MNKKIIFGLVGQQASGKEETKKYLAEKYNSKDCKFSASLRDILSRAGIEISRANMQKISQVLRENFGQNILAKIIAKDAMSLDSDIVVIDGVRRFDDIEYLSKLPNFVLVAIAANPELRFERVLKRKENVGDDTKTFEQFLKDNEAEADREIPEVMKSAKYTILNEGTIEELYKQINEVIKKLS